MKKQIELQESLKNEGLDIILAHARYEERIRDSDPDRAYKIRQELIGLLKDENKAAHRANRLSLTDDDVREVRILSHEGMKTADIARSFKVSYATVWNILNGYSRSKVQ